MQITRAILPLLSVLQGGGLNRHIRGWNRILAMAFPHDKQESRHLRTRRWGLTYLANPANYIDWNVLCFGDYERGDLDLFKRLGRPGSVCLDVGANVEHHAIFFGSLGWTVHAFEPNPQLWGEFEAKVVASGLSAVTLHRIGLGAEDETLPFELENPTNSGTGRFASRVALDHGSLALGRLPIRKGDTYLKQIGIHNVDFVKMDIQGFEPEALLGLRATLTRNRPIISVEASRENIEKFTSFDGFRRHLPEDYFCVRLRHQITGPLRTATLEHFNGDIQTLDGNLFCFPRERAEI